MIVKRKAPRTFTKPPGWTIVGERGFYFRSTWEVKFAMFLEVLKEKDKITEWLYEPETFWFNEIKRGTRSYLPDFKVMNLDGSHCWVEVKGYMDAKSKTKIKRFKKYYPEEKLKIADGKWFKSYDSKILE